MGFPPDESSESRSNHFDSGWDPKIQDCPKVLPRKSWIQPPPESLIRGGIQDPRLRGGLARAILDPAPTRIIRIVFYSGSDQYGCICVSIYTSVNMTVCTYLYVHTHTGCRVSSIQGRGEGTNKRESERERERQKERERDREKKERDREKRERDCVEAMQRHPEDARVCWVVH